MLENARMNNASATIKNSVKIEEPDKEVQANNQGVLPDELTTRLITASNTALCKIQHGNLIGNGFLCAIRVSREFRYGVLTNNHLLPSSAFSEEIKITFAGLNTTITLSDLMIEYCFTCEFLDVTFIELKPSVLEDFANKGIKFLQAAEGTPAPLSSIVYVVENKDVKEMAFVPTAVTEYRGVDILYDISSAIGTSGYPVLWGNEFEVVSIQRTYDDSYCSRSTDIQYIVSAIQKDYQNGWCPVPRQARQLTEKDLGELRILLGLEPLVTDRLFIHHLKELEKEPADCVDRLVFKGKKYQFETLEPTKVMWFYRTHTSWYCTPLDPQKEQPFWMEISGHRDEPWYQKFYIVQYLERHGEFYCL